MLAVGGAVFLGHNELRHQREAFDTTGRIAHRLLSQQVVQHDAILATLALLIPGDNDPPAQNLPSVYPQIQRMQYRAAGQPWQEPTLDAAEAAARRSGHAQVAVDETSEGRYRLVTPAGNGAYALTIDLIRVVPREEWPLPPGPSDTRVTLQWQDQAPYVLQEGAPATGPGWPLSFGKTLSSQSQPFDLHISRHMGWTELPWLGMALWVALVGVASALWRAWQSQTVARQRAEDLLRMGQVQRLNTLGELAAGMAHELNQPLTAVVANTQAASRLLRESPDADPTALHAMTQAVAQAQRAAEVVSRLRRVIERPTTPAASPEVALQPAVRNVLHLLDPDCRQRQVTPRLDAPDHDLRVLADPVALEQILHNLTSNALQALEHTPPEQRELIIRLRARQQVAQLDVIDTGCGISPEAMPQLFQPFFSAREGGLGLGLSLCETLATNMGGQLSAHHRDDGRGGAVFTLTLPLAP